MVTSTEAKKSMYCLQTVVALQGYLAQLRQAPAPASVGFVPTMGALHEGHFSLIKRARAENSTVVVSLFVNPLQFAPHEDFDQYPQSFAADRDRCAELGVDLLFTPNTETLYDRQDLGPGLSQVLTQVHPPKAMTTVLCGRSRPMFFHGVATVVTKLLSLVQPDRAYFGQKDAQQLAIIRQLTRDLNLPGVIIGCPIVRAVGGLALSSRNQYLSEAERQDATILYRGLSLAQQHFNQGEYAATNLISAVQSVVVTRPRVQLEYVELVHPDTMQPLENIQEQGLLAVAAQVGSARLIDNLVLNRHRPLIAIDGPAGAGKSTVTRRVAQALGLLYLDTGAMYRAVTWLALDAHCKLTDEIAIADLVGQCNIQFEFPHPYADATGQTIWPPTQVWINERDVTQVIRSPEVTRHVSTIAAQPIVRQQLVIEQRRYGQQGGLVAEGRDIGTVVFPNAELKIFLTASVTERARRRQQDLTDQGQPFLSLDQLEQEIEIRDQKDSSRTVAPLVKAADAVEIKTDDLSIDTVVNKIVDLYENCLNQN